MNKNAKIYVAGHCGLVGSAIMRNLQKQGYVNIIVRSHTELDLLDQNAVYHFFEKEKPEFVFLAAAKVGGIFANDRYSASFIFENLQIETHIIDAAYKNEVTKLLFLGSSCIYPQCAPQPLKEEYLLTGPLEPTNKAYAIAKIAGIIMCQSYNKQYGTNFISVMPTNLYGPYDNFDLQTSHVLPAMLRKIYEAKESHAPMVTLWGTGNPRREFLYVDDLADACVFLMQNYNESEIINIGTGEDISIAELARMIKEVVGYTGKIIWDTTKPNGTPRKLLDVTKLHNLGWHHNMSLREGISHTVSWFLDNYYKDK